MSSMILVFKALVNSGRHFLWIVWTNYSPCEFLGILSQVYVAKSLVKKIFPWSNEFDLKSVNPSINSQCILDYGKLWWKKAVSNPMIPFGHGTFVLPNFLWHPKGWGGERNWLRHSYNFKAKIKVYFLLRSSIHLLRWCPQARFCLITKTDTK